AGSGRRVVTNAEGSNLARGLTAALVAAPPGARDAVLEVDEAVLPGAIAELRPDLVVLLNLTRHQLDRHHEIDSLAARWPAPPARPGARAARGRLGRPRSPPPAQAAPSAWRAAGWPSGPTCLWRRTATPWTPRSPGRRPASWAPSRRRRSPRSPALAWSRTA